MEDAAKLIVGAWRLVHSVITGEQGHKKCPTAKTPWATSATATAAS